MVRKFLVFSEEEKQHEYTITSKLRNDGCTVHTLFHSNGEQWSETTKGTRCLRIIEGDSEMEIVNDKKGMKPYCEIIEMKILIDFIISGSNNGRYKIIEEKDVLIID